MHRSTLAAAVLPLILVLAACSSGGGATTAPASQPAASAPASSAPAASGAAGASASAETSETYELKVAAGSGSVTNYLTGEDGKTLYVFALDTADSGKSACGAGPCLDNWPPFVVESLDVLEVTGEAARDRDVHVREARDCPVGDAEVRRLPELVEPVLRREAHRHARHRTGE